MKNILSIFILTLCLPVAGQQVVGGEYFFDTDPGYGEGIALNFAPADSIDIETPISFTDLTSSFHYLFIRFVDDSGHWSFNEQRTIFVQQLPPVDETIVDAEYFIDVEPGLGQGTHVALEAVSDSLDQSFAIAYNDLTPGFHYLFFRVKNQYGLWSLVDQRCIYVVPDNTVQETIVGGEFFVDIEPGLGLGTPFTMPDPSANIDTDLGILLPDLSLGSHILYMRFKNESGNWSLIEPRPFTVCETYGAVSNFTKWENGNMLVLEDHSQYADSVLWNFGDGTTSNLSDPIHFYQEAGVYNVAQYSFNTCAVDTMTVQVVVEGVESVYPGQVSDVTVSTLTIKGFGFVDGTTFKLTRIGFSDILPSTTTVSNALTLVGLVNFTGQALGLWNVEVEIPGEGTFVLSDALEIIHVPLTNEAVLMSSTQVGGTRTGRRMPANMHIQNNNYADVLALPVVFRDITEVQQILLTTEAPITQVPFFIDAYQYLLDNNISNTVMEDKVVSPATNSGLLGLMIPKVKSSSSYDIPYYIKRTTDGTHKRGSLMIFPQITAASQIGTVEYQNDLCLSSFIQVATETSFSVVIDDAEWDACYQYWQDSLYASIASIAANDSISPMPVSLPACIVALLTHMKEGGCISTMPTLTATGLKEVAAHVMANLVFLNDASDVTANCPQLQGMQIDPHQVDDFASGATRTNEFCELAQSVGGSSMLSFGGRANQWCALFGSGIDPNMKYGPGDNNEDVYVNPGDIVGYDITFENDPEATAPVEFITVTDTLEAARFDLSTFRWGAVTLGDSILIVPESEALSQVMLKDLRPALPYFLLCELSFDTATAVIRWDFKTLDTLNLQAPDMSLDGFLPPNINGNEGSGDVSFFIQLNPELVTGDSIQNRAIITFDFNQPVITPFWTNVVDLGAPTSEVADLPVTQVETTFLVNWSGTDEPAGIDSYTVYVSKDDGPFLPWIIMVDTLNAPFTGVVGSTYKYYSLAIDNAGNWEQAPEDPWTNYDAITQIIIDDITELNAGVQLALYPNPGEDHVTMAMQLTESSSVRTEFTNMIGQAIGMGGVSDKPVMVNAGSYNQDFDTSHLAAGVYVLRVYVNDAVITRRFVRK